MPSPHPSSSPSSHPTTYPSSSPSNQPSLSKNSKEVGAAPVVEQKYRATDGGCLKSSEAQVDICLDSEHSSDVAVHCCKGSMEENDLKCSRDKCVTVSTFAAATDYCEDQGMRLCSVAELESGACCDKGCGWNWQISWTSDRCETSNSHPTTYPSQPTTAASRSISNSSNYITSEAMANPSFGLWEIISLTLLGILFCFVALGCRFVRKKRSRHRQAEEGGDGWLSWLSPAGEEAVKDGIDGWLSWQSPFWPGGERLDQNQVSAPAEEEEMPEEEGNGRLSWQSPFQPGRERLDQSQGSASVETDDVPEEEEDGWLSRQTQFWLGGVEEDTISHSASSSGSNSSSSASASGSFGGS